MSARDTKWKAEYSVGNALLDEQHRQLLGLCGDVAACMAQGGQDREPLDNLLVELSRYARIHFAAEEALLSKIKYPRLAEQLAEHREYDENITAFLVSATFRRVKPAKLQVALSEYLEDWWLKHILDSDMQYKRYL